VCCQVVHRTVSSAPGPSTIKPATLGKSKGTLRYNSPDCPVCTGLSGEPAEQRLPARQRSTAQMNSDEQYSDRSQSAEVRCHRTVWCGTGLSGAAKRQRSPTVNSDCPVRHRTVRCAHRQQTLSTARKWLGL
jgi:hypothetical protein